MKKILIVLAAAITIASCKEADKTAEATTTTSTAPATESLTPAPNTAAAPQQNTVDPATLTKVEWLDGVDKDFGKIKEGAVEQRDDHHGMTLGEFALGLVDSIDGQWSFRIVLGSREPQLEIVDLEIIDAGPR